MTECCCAISVNIMGSQGSLLSRTSPWRNEGYKKTPDMRTEPSSMGPGKYDALGTRTLFSFSFSFVLFQLDDTVTQERSLILSRGNQLLAHEDSGPRTCSSMCNWSVLFCIIYELN